MSDKNLAQEVADLLKTDAGKAADRAVDLRMKDLPGIVSKELEGLPGIVRKEMDACLDGKCDAIAERLVAKLPKAEASTMSVEDITKAVQAAMEEGGSHLNVEGHTAHDILDCPTCKPIIVNKLWESEEYRQAIAEKVCEDEECRNLFIKQFGEKGYEVTEAGRKDESWSEQRLRERGA
jgi:hypothetical protein